MRNVATMVQPKDEAKIHCDVDADRPRGPLSGIKVLDLERLHRRAERVRAAGRSRCGSHQDRASGGRHVSQVSVDAGEGSARVPWREPKQARHRARPQEARRPGGADAHGRIGGRARAQFPAECRAPPAHRLPASQGDQPAAYLLQRHGLRRNGPAAGKGRLRPGPAGHDRNLQLCRARKRSRRSSMVPSSITTPRRWSPTESPRHCFTASGRAKGSTWASRFCGALCAMQSARFIWADERRTRRRPGHALRRDHRAASDQGRLHLPVGQHAAFLVQPLRADRPARVGAESSVTPPCATAPNMPTRSCRRSARH